MSAQRSRGWCFTINNYDDEDIENLMSFIDNNERCQYICAGLEIGEQGTHHVQGFVYFPNKISFGGLRKLLVPGTHLEVQKGSNDQAINYCKKENDWFEDGTKPEMGKRTDLEEIVDNIKKNVPMKEIATNYPSQYLRYSGSLEKMANLVGQKEQPCNVYLYRGQNSGDYGILNFKDPLFVYEERDWYKYDNNDCVICEYQFGVKETDLKLLSLGRGYTAVNGYMSKKIYPPIVIFKNNYINRNDTLFNYIEDIITD